MSCAITLAGSGGRIQDSSRPDDVADVAGQARPRFVSGLFEVQNFELSLLSASSICCTVVAIYTERSLVLAWSENAAVAFYASAAEAAEVDDGGSGGGSGL